MRIRSPQAPEPVAPAAPAFGSKNALRVSARSRASPCRASALPRQVETQALFWTSSSSAAMSTGPLALGPSCWANAPAPARRPIARTAVGRRDFMTAFVGPGLFRGTLLLLGLDAGLNPAFEDHAIALVVHAIGLRVDFSKTTGALNGA